MEEQDLFTEAKDAWRELAMRVMPVTASKRTKELMRRAFISGVYFGQTEMLGKAGIRSEDEEVEALEIWRKNTEAAVREFAR